MSDPALQELRGRVEWLERANRRQRQLGMLLLLGMVAAVLMGQISPSKVAKAVEAERFVLRDTGGKIRGLMFTTLDGAPILGLVDPEGEFRALLTVGSDGAPSLSLLDKGEKARAVLTVDGGTPRLSLHEKDQGLRLALSVAANGAPSLALHHKERHPRALVGLGPDGAPHLTLSASDGKPRATLGLVAATNEASRLDFFDKSGRVVWKAP